MRKSRFFMHGIIAVMAGLFIAGGFLNPYALAYEKDPVEISNTIDRMYQEALVLYKKKRYDLSQERLHSILQMIESNHMVQLWRQNTKARPTEKVVKEMISDIEVVIARQQNQRQGTINQREERRDAVLARRMAEAELARRKREQQSQLRAEQIVVVKQDWDKKHAALAAQIEAEREELAAQRAAKKAQVEQQREELRLKQKEERRLREDEVERLAQLKQAQQQMEREQRAEQRIARDEERQREKEEALKARAAAREQAEAAKLVSAQERQREKQALEVKRAELRQRAEEERIALKAERERQKEEALKARISAREQAETAKLVKAQERERLQEQRQQAREQRAVERAEREREIAAKRDEVRKQEEMLLAKQQAAEEKVRKAQEKARIAQEKAQLAQQQTLLAEKLAQEKSLLAQKLAEEKVREQASVLDTPVQTAKLTLQDEVRQLEIDVLRKKRVRQPAPAKANAADDAYERKVQHRVKTPPVNVDAPLDRKALREQERMRRAAQHQTKREEQAQAKRAMRRMREEDRQAKLEERKRRRALLTTEQQERYDEQQQKALKHSSHRGKEQHDAEMIRRVESLWKQSNRLYKQGMYDQAIGLFQEIIVLEGNPRIKYTPYAEKLIKQAEDRMSEKQKLDRHRNKVQRIEDTEDEMMEEVFERQIPPYVNPPKVTVELEKDSLIEPPVVRKKMRKKRVTMDFDKVGLQSVMRFLSKESGINYVASQNVLNLDPVVTARFQNTTLEEVTKYITKSLGLIYRVDKDVVWIADPEEIANEAMETRVYYLTKGGGLFTEFSSLSGGDTGLGGSSSSINQVFTIEDTLKEMVPWPGDAKLTYDKRLNALIVRNTPQNLQMMEDIIYNLDVEPCQILIEARFIEIDVTDTKELGFEFKSTSDLPIDEENGQFSWGMGPGGVDFTDFTRAAEGLNLAYKGVLTQPQFDVILHALDENKKIKTLSSPRITTLNNQLASIKVVDEWIYPSRYEYEVVQSDINGDGDFADAGETTYKNVPKDFLRRDVGIILKVIPAVGADRRTISLSLIPEVSDATEDAFTFAGDVSLPKFTSRNLSTTVVVNSADTVVLGGLVKENRTHTVTKVPLLGDIPFLGNLFKKDTDLVTRKNLLIFVTAKVLNPQGQEVVVAQK